MSAIILVGGEGRRITTVAPGRPKPLIEVAGQPFLHWVTRWVEAQGEHEIVLAACHMADQIQAWAAAEGQARPACKFSVALEPSPLGTGGGLVHAASRHPDNYYICLNGDSATFVSLKPALDWLKSDPGLDGVIIAKQLNNASHFGALDIGPAGQLRGFHEKQPGAGRGWINAGIYLLRAKLLALEPKPMSIEFDCFPRWLADGARIGVLASHADFLDIGTPETLAKACAFIEANRALLDDPAKLVPVQRVV